MFFDLKNTAIYQAVVWRKFFLLNKKLKKFFLIFFLLSLLILIILFYQQQHLIFKGVSLILFCLLIASYLHDAFFEHKLKKPVLKNNLKEALENPSEINLASFLNYESARALYKLLGKYKKKELKDIQADSLLYYFLLSLRQSPEINFILSRLLITPKEILTQIHIEAVNAQQENFVSVEEIIFRAAQIAHMGGQKRIKAGNILVALSESSLVLKKIFIKKDVKKEDVKGLNWWFNFIEEETQLKNKFWSKDNLARKSTVAKYLSYGFTVNLDRFSLDLTTSANAQQMLQTVFFHHQALDACETILSNEQGINNVLLVGEQGVGVSTIVYKLAERFLLDKSLPSLNPKRVIMLNLSLIFSQDVTGNTKDKARVILEAICKEVINAGNIVLVIDRFQDYVCTKDNAALISVLDVLSSYLPLPNFQLILIVDHQGLANIVGFYPYLLNLVEKVEVREPAIEEVYRVIEGKIFYLERKYNEFITYPAIRVIIECSGKYIPEKVFPKKATDLLTQVVADVAKKRKKRIIFPQDVYAVISDKIGFQVGPLGLGEKEKLINLEEMLHQGIVAQDQAIQEISNTLRRARAEIAIRKGPMGAFLFLGPTGVGKTETTKVLANIYFGSKEKILRFDMAEYQNPEDIVRLIGSETTSGYLATKVRENPFSLVLLDEIEKAHYSILDLFLTILDEGYFTTPLGNKKISFINTLIIATSNFGYKIILNSFKQKREKNIEIDLDKLKKEIIDDSFAQAIFKPEFINRFDGVILFHPLDKNHLFQISGLLFDSLKKNLAEKDIELIVTDEIRNKIIELGYNIIYGAREMRRVIQERVENPISMSLLRGEIEKGDRIEIDPRDFRVIKR